MRAGRIAGGKVRLAAPATAGSRSTRQGMVMAKMDEGYFDERRGSAFEHVEFAANELNEVRALIAAFGYNSPMLSSSWLHRV